jgi:hypothetical protein
MNIVMNKTMICWISDGYKSVALSHWINFDESQTLFIPLSSNWKYQAHMFDLVECEKRWKCIGF